MKLTGRQDNCPYCQSYRVRLQRIERYSDTSIMMHYTCSDCAKKFDSKLTVMNVEIVFHLCSGEWIKVQAIYDLEGYYQFPEGFYHSLLEDCESDYIYDVTRSQVLKTRSPVAHKLWNEIPRDMPLTPKKHILELLSKYDPFYGM